MVSAVIDSANGTYVGSDTADDATFQGNSFAAPFTGTIDGAGGTDTLIFVGGPNPVSLPTGRLTQFDLFQATLRSVERFNYNSTSGEWLNVRIRVEQMVDGMVLTGSSGRDGLAMESTGTGDHFIPNLTLMNWGPGVGSFTDFVALRGAGTLHARDNLAGLQVLIAAAANTNLIGSNGADVLQVTVSSDSGLLEGNAGDDTLVLNATSMAPLILSNLQLHGGAGTDQLLVNGTIVLNDPDFLDLERITLNPSPPIPNVPANSGSSLTINISAVSAAEPIQPKLAIGGLGALNINIGAGTGLLDFSQVTVENDTSVLLTVTGSDEANQIIGSIGDDVLIGRGGPDSLLGGVGDDMLDGGAGIDMLNGGDGVDTASYGSASASVAAYLTWEAGGSGDAAGDHFLNIENLAGSAFSDLLGGNDGQNVIDGGDGSDWLIGLGGDDTLLGGNGLDVLVGGLGADRLEGGADVDLAFYRDAPVRVYNRATDGAIAGMVDGHSYGIGLDVVTPSNGFGEAKGDVLVDVENVWGSRFDDVIRVGDISGQVYGFEGNDILEGGSGASVFYGGDKADLITMGAGADISFYLSWNDHVNIYGTPEPYEGGDTYTDFKHGEDRIILSRYWFGFGNIPGPAAALTTQYADFLVDTATPASAKPTLIWDSVARTLSFDADGTGATTAVLLGTFQAGATMTLSDIWTA